VRTDDVGNRVRLYLGTEDSITPYTLTLNSWQYFVLTRSSGVCSIYLNGILKSTHNFAESITNDVTSFGIDTAHTSTKYLKGSLALWRISATAPSAEEIKEIYEAEKVLFQDNANCTLNGSSDAVTAMDYDDYNDELLVGTSGGLSVFKGLRRVEKNDNAITEVAQQGGLRVEEY
jgi:hypothetical protein